MVSDQNNEGTAYVRWSNNRRFPGGGGAWQWKARASPRVRGISRGQGH